MFRDRTERHLMKIHLGKEIIEDVTTIQRHVSLEYRWDISWRNDKNLREIEQQK